MLTYIRLVITKMQLISTFFDVEIRGLKLGLFK